MLYDTSEWKRAAALAATEENKHLKASSVCWVHPLTRMLLTLVKHLGFIMSWLFQGGAEKNAPQTLTQLFRNHIFR